MPINPTGILLAAGYSRRFGSNKLLHPLADGTPMVIAAAQTLRAALGTCIAVVNDATLNIVKQLEHLDIQVVINDHAEIGIGSSIARGVRASPLASGWIIALADMPYLRAETISLITHKLNTGAHMVAPTYQQQRGHPVGFHRRYYDELLQLSTDIGARSIISKHKNDLELIETLDPGVITDIDVTTDLPNATHSCAHN